MGGRGASSGVSNKGKPYGSEYRTVLQDGNIKFVKVNFGSATPPMETMTKNRVYVTLGSNGNPRFISYYDQNNKRVKQIDLEHPHQGVSPHVHHGYEHAEKDSVKGYARLTTQEKKMVERVREIWYNKHGK